MMADSSNGVLFGRDSQGTKTTPDHIGELKKKYIKRKWVIGEQVHSVILII